MDTKLCKLCNRECNDCRSSGAGWTFNCERCGKYIITDDAFDREPESFVKDNLHLISAVTRKSKLMLLEKSLFTNRSEFEAEILSRCRLETQQKINCIVEYIAKKVPYPGEATHINIDCDYPLFYCKGRTDLMSYLWHLRDREIIEIRSPSAKSTAHSTYCVELTVNGYQEVEKLTKPNTESKQAFVAMWFDDQMTPAFSDGILLLEEDTGFTMLRIDMKEFNDKICDRILAEIRKSRFVIADVTEQRQGVYFEAGFAMGLGLPVIWTCREDQIEQCHFDTRQYNHITWKTENELREKLKHRILATIGEAPKT